MRKVKEVWQPDGSAEADVAFGSMWTILPRLREGFAGGEVGLPDPGFFPEDLFRLRKVLEGKPGLLLLAGQDESSLMQTLRFLAELLPDPRYHLAGSLGSNEAVRDALSAVRSGRWTLGLLAGPDEFAALAELGQRASRLSDRRRAVVIERQVARICHACAHPVRYRAEELAQLGLVDGKDRVGMIGAGCERCGGSGRMGLTRLF